MDTSKDRLEHLRSRTWSMVEHLRAVVEAESPSSEPALTGACASVIRSIGKELLGADPSLLERDGRVHLLWRFGEETQVLLVGHLDTVWPAGTIDRWPFDLNDGRATGPGAFDMKSGIVQSLHGLSTLDSLEGVALLLTSDEEIGSPTSAAVIREMSSSARAALILEPAERGALKIARKGVSMYQMEIAGRASHAGLEPEKGANALVELAHQVLALQAMADPTAGTSVTPTIAVAGSATNVVPATARLEIDVRALTIVEQDRIHSLMAKVEPHVEGIRIAVEGEPNRPPMEPSTSAELFARAKKIAERLGIGALSGVTVGGASDGNFTAAEGCPTLDGLGGVGDGAHGEGEYVLISEMAPRAGLLASLVEEIQELR